MISIVVSFIALFGVIITALIGFLTWSRNLKYQILKDERDRLEKKGEFVLDQYAKCLGDNSINAKLAAVLMYEFPKNVAEEFEKWRQDGVFSSDDEQKKKRAYFNIAFEISKAIRDYNKKIQQTNEFVDKQFALKQLTEIVKMIPHDFIKLF
jgi:hypothetical protein